jgi:hypothetical protein
MTESTDQPMLMRTVQMLVRNALVRSEAGFPVQGTGVAAEVDVSEPNNIKMKPIEVHTGLRVRAAPGCGAGV